MTIATATLPAPSKELAVCVWCHDQFPSMPELYCFPGILELLEHAEAHA